MAKQLQSFFLEEWLRSITLISSNKSSSVHSSSSSSAQAIIQAWADLRDSLKHQSFHTHHLQALKILVSSQASLYVSDPQAKLLLSILSLQNLCLPQESYPLFLRLLYIWVRKSRQSSLVVDSAIEVLLHLISKQSHSDESSLFFSEGILLLGALSSQLSASGNSKRACLGFLCKLLKEKYRFISSSDELASNALAGAGYALSSSASIYFGRILDILVNIWDQEGGPSGSISQGLMLLHLIEWVQSTSLNLRSLDKIESTREVLDIVRPAHSSVAVVMIAAGVLRALNRSGSSDFLQLNNSAEKCIEFVARDLVSRTKGFNYGNEPRPNLLLQSLALALARSGSVSYQASLPVSLALALLTEVFPLQRIYSKILKSPEENWIGVLEEIKQHLSSVIFKEAGAITGVFCNQYASANEDAQSRVENLVWEYCQEVYLWHRQTTLLLLGRGDHVIREIEKIAESAFLMVAVFALGYFRQMRLPEYMDTIRAVIVSVQENEEACISFVESIPSYDDLTNNGGSSNFTRVEYSWSADEVQTARIIFYMRVIPTCVERLPASVFKKLVVPTMFLYMGHPNSKVARYSHSMFVAFVSSGKDPTPDERILLKEQLVFYYLERSLEGYPDITPFEGMASGVAALVRHLPAGNPSIFYCIHCLVEKARILCSMVSSRDTDIWKKWDGDLEPSKKVLDLLIRLLSLVDIQVLPSLMKSLAELIVQLPSSGQSMLLNQLYQQVAESDDVIRKPALVSWLQSLSYLCSQDLVGQTASAKTMGTTSLNRIDARL
ncbi:hypothetical protein ACJIZ3_024013 [Penstemon smallii]|uniref:Uncharacterized protein n=1 Tax=Penstemon smallii TaxID=265156 RepID=A0ABD3TT10_9LAMI